MTGDVGGRLRQARKQCGLSLPDVAGRTKLSIGVLQAIERNDFESLPPGIYRRSYLRLLASEVGLDPKAIAAHYEREFEPVPAADNGSTGPEDHQVAALTPVQRRSIVALIVLIALAMMVRFA
jgi:cytoskeleton protein RodZ